MTPAEAAGPPELVALRALKLGDLLVAVPAIKALRRGHPEHRVVLAVPGWLQRIVELIPGVDAVLPTPGLDRPLPLAPGRIDTVVDLHGNADSRRLLEALGARRRIGHEAPGWPGPRWLDGIHERVRWARLVTAYGMPADPDDVAIDQPATASPRPGCVVLHVGAFYGCRAWPVERFAAVGAALGATGEHVVITGGQRDQPRAVSTAQLAGLGPERMMAGRIDLDIFAALVAEARLLVSVDTGAAHLASAYRTPSVVIFGPSPREEWGPPAGGPHLIRCHDHLRRGDAFAAEPDPALLAVTTEEVLDAAQVLLESPPGRCPPRMKNRPARVAAGGFGVQAGRSQPAQS